MNALKEGGVTKKWGAALQEPFQRRNVFMGELKRVGVLNPQAIGIASISRAHTVLFADFCCSHAKCMPKRLMPLQLLLAYNLRRDFKGMTVIRPQRLCTA